MAYLKDLLKKPPIRIKHVDVEEEYVHDGMKDFMYLKERYSLEQLLSDGWEEVKSEKQIIKELELLIDQLRHEITTLKSELLIVKSLEKTITHVPITYPAPCQHEYPNPWMATVPPFCKKCGQQAPNGPTWTVTTTTTDSSGIIISNPTTKKDG